MTTRIAATIDQWLHLGQLFVMTELRLRVLVLLGLSAIGFVGGFAANWVVG